MSIEFLYPLITEAIRRAETLEDLRAPGARSPTPEDTLALKKTFVLRADPDLARGERLHVGSGESQSRSPLHQDFLALLAELL
jgi:hypothetical protein